MAKPAEKVGRGKCPQCDSPVTFKRSAGGLLTYTCDDCDTSGYAQPGGTGHAKWSATITSTAGPAASPAAPVPPAPAPAKKAASFDLENL